MGHVMFIRLKRVALFWGVVLSAIRAILEVMKKEKEELKLSKELYRASIFRKKTVHWKGNVKLFF